MDFKITRGSVLWQSHVYTIKGLVRLRGQRTKLRSNIGKIMFVHSLILLWIDWLDNKLAKILTLLKKNATRTHHIIWFCHIRCGERSVWSDLEVKAQNVSNFVQETPIILFCGLENVAPSATSKMLPLRQHISSLLSNLCRATSGGYIHSCCSREVSFLWG